MCFLDIRQYPLIQGQVILAAILELLLPIPGEQEIVFMVAQKS